MKQQVIYSRENINEILLNYVVVDVHFKSQNNTIKIVTKINLHYDWKEIVKSELKDEITDFYNLINKQDVFEFLPFLHLVGVIKQYNAFQVQDPVLEIFKKGDYYTIAQDQDNIKEYFTAIINVFRPRFENNEFHDNKINYEEKILNKLSFWINLNRDQSSQFNLPDNFPGLIHLCKIIEKLHYIAFLNYCLKKNEFNYNINIPGIKEDKVIGIKELFSYQWIDTKNDSLFALYNNLCGRLVNVDYNNFEKAFNNTSTDEILPIQINFSSSELVYFIDCLMKKKKVINEKRLSIKRIHSCFIMANGKPFSNNLSAIRSTLKKEDYTSNYKILSLDKRKEIDKILQF